VLPGPAHPRALACFVTELCSDDDARLRVEAAQVLEGHRHLGQIRDREQLRVRRQFRYPRMRSLICGGGEVVVS